MQLALPAFVPVLSVVAPLRLRRGASGLVSQPVSIVILNSHNSVCLSQLAPGSFIV